MLKPMSRLEESGGRCSKDINIMDTDGGEDDEDSSDGDNVCMGSPIVNVEDDALSPDISTLHVENDNTYQCDISDLLIVGDSRPISDATSVNLEVLDDLRLSSEHPGDDLYMELRQPHHNSNASSTMLISRPTASITSQNLECDIDLLKPVVFSSSASYLGNASNVQPKSLSVNGDKSLQSYALNSKSPAISKSLRASTAVTSVLPTAMMTTILCGPRTSAKINETSNQSSSFQFKNSLNVAAKDKSIATMSTSHNNISPQISANTISQGIVPEHGKIQNTKKLSDGEPIKLPESLESLPKSDHFPTQRHRWNTNEEIASMLIAFERHNEWLSKEVKIRPKSGSTLLYSRKKVRYRRDGYCWKKRKDGKTTREDHMKLKVQGIECIYGCYVHSAILPTFHRRCYWLLQNPDVVLVHYLNVPYPDDNKMLIANSVNLWAEKKEWTKEELICQLKPMFFSEEEPDLNNELEISTAETVEAIVTQLMEKQRNARQAALNKQLECGCPETNATNGDKLQCCIHNTTTTAAVSTVRNSQHKVQATKSEAHTTTGRSRTSKQNQRMLRLMQENNNQVTSTTGHLGNLGSLANQELHHQQQQHQQHHHLQHNQSPPNHPYMHHHQAQHHGQGNQPSLVLSLSQIQTGGGLLILNGNGGNGMNATGTAMPPSNLDASSVHRTDVNNHLNRLTPLTLPPATAVTPLSCSTDGSSGSTTSNSGNLTLMHSNRSDTMESSGSSNSPLDSVGGGSGGLGATSPVASAVRSLTSLSDFSLLEGGTGTTAGSGNFDAYSGLQPITDSLLSGVGNVNGNGEDLLGGGNGIRKSDNHSTYSNKVSSINTSATTTLHQQFGGHHGRALINHPGSGIGMPNNNNNNSGGPLLDFKSAFSVLDDKPGSLSFLHENTFENNHEDMHRSIGMIGGNNKNQANPHHRNVHNQGHVQQQHHPVSLQQQQHSLQQTHHSTSSAFGTHPADLNPMDFIEQDIIQGGNHHQSSGAGMMSNAQHTLHQANSGSLVASNFDVNLDAPFDMMSAFPDLDPSQFNAGSGGADNQHSPLLHQNIPGPMLSSSPMNNLIKNEGGMGLHNRNQQAIRHHSDSITRLDHNAAANSQQMRQQQPNHSNHMQHLSHQHHAHGHPHISDYSPEWGWTDGGCKLLVILSWNENSHVNQLTHNCDVNGKHQDPRLQSGPILYSHYEVLFNGVGVPTTEVQPGVLRCLIPEHDSGMVQLQVACYKKLNIEEGLDSRNLPKKDDCDIISELLFHNDGAKETEKHILTQPVSPSLPQSNGNLDKQKFSSERYVLKTNIVMFEYREQSSNTTEEEAGPFVSFFDNDYDLIEQENKQKARSLNGHTDRTVSSEICASTRCSNNYLCRTVACNKNLKIELLGKMENFLALSTPTLDYSCSNGTESQKTKSQLWNSTSSDERIYLQQNNSNNTQIQVATHFFEDYVMSVFKDIINTCNQIILQEPNNVGNGGHYIHHQRTTENDQHSFFPSHTDTSNSGISRIIQPASCKANCDSKPYLFNQMEERNPHNLKCCLQNKDSFISSNLPKDNLKSEDSELKLIHMAASLGLTRFCRLLSDFGCMPCCYETTDDKNGLSSSSWAFVTHEGEKKSTPVLSRPNEDKTSGGGKEETWANNRLEENCGCYFSSSSTSTSMKNQNNISRAKYTLLRLKEESNILYQDRIGFTPLMRACYMEHQKTIEFLCEKDPTALRIKNSSGQTCMDLASQSLNPLIANLLEKKCLETSSSDELQMGNRKRVNYYNGDNNRTTENNSFTNSFENKETVVKEKMKKSISLKCNETDGVTHCKHHCQLDNSLPSSQWRAKSLDGHDRSYSSSNLNANSRKHTFQSIYCHKPNLKDFQKPLMIHIDHHIPSSSSYASKGFRAIPSTVTTTSSTIGPKDTTSSLHVPCSISMKANNVLTHGQRRLSKRSSFDSGIHLSSCHQRQHSSPHLQPLHVSKVVHHTPAGFQCGSGKTSKSCIDDNVRSKMSRASSLPSSNKNNHQSASSIASHRTNAPTQAEVVKTRILKSEAENQILQDILKNKNANKVKVKIENDDSNPASPYVDVEALSDGDEKVECETDVKQEPEPLEGQRVLNLAEQFIAAMPARIKNEGDVDSLMLDISNQTAGNNGANSNFGSTCSPLICDTSQSDDLGIESMGDDLDFEFDFNLQDVEDNGVSGRFGYREVLGTPSESAFSVSPTSSSFLHSPSRSSFTFESPSPCGTSFSVDTDPSPQGTTQDLQEFLQASLKCERDLSYLTLSDQEQRELYEAAQIIQKAYRSYKGRSSKGKGVGKGTSNSGGTSSNQDDEARAAVLIQNYYRRYKQYLYWKQMANAATVIQNKYRTYCENKRFKKSKDAAMCIQSYYRTYKENRTGRSSVRSSRESTPSTSAGVKRTYSQRRQNQAAKKIQQFMKKTHLKLRNERVALPAASARLVRPLGDPVCRPNCLPVLVQQAELLETAPISQHQTAVTVQAQAPTTTMPPPPLPVPSVPIMSCPVPRMDAQNHAIASMELPTTEEMGLTMFNLPEDNTITETQVQTQTMDVMDTLIPMDSHSNNITQEQHQELQDVTDLLAEVEARVNTALTTANPCIISSNNTIVSTDGQICQQQEQMQAHALLQHSRLLQTPPLSLSPHLPQP